jgi:hypothetical protein
MVKTMRPELTPYKDYAFRIAKLYGTIIKTEALALEDHKAIMQVQDEYQRTILHYLAVQGAVKAINSVAWNRGANVGVRDFEGNTPLHYGTIHYSIGTVGCLLRNGANPKVHNNAGQTSGNFDHVESLRSIGKLSAFLRNLITNPTGLPSDAIAAVRGTNEPEEDWIIRSLALNITTHKDGFNEEEIKIAMVNAREVANGNEFPPLQITAELGHIAWVKALIRAGANPERVPEKIEYKSNVRADVRTEINKIIADEKVAFALKEKTILDQYIRESSLEAERNRAVTAVSITVTAPGGSPFSTAARCTTDSNPADVACVPQQLFAGLNPLTTSLVKG